MLHNTETMAAVRNMPLGYIPHYFLINTVLEQNIIHRESDHRGSAQLWYFSKALTHCHTKDWKTGTGIKSKIVCFITATVANG